MSSLIADGVMAATHKLVQQAMAGQWQEAPRTVEKRRALLDRLSTGAAPQDQPWLSALQQAMAESDAHSADGIRLARWDPSVPESNHPVVAHSAARSQDEPAARHGRTTAGGKSSTAARSADQI